MWWCLRRSEFHEYMETYKDWTREKREEQNIRLDRVGEVVSRLSCDLAQIKQFVNDLKQERHNACVRAEYAEELLDDTLRPETQNEVLAVLEAKLDAVRGKGR